MSRVPLELNVQIEDAGGRTFRWGPDEIPENRLRNISFSTKIGEGFSSAQGQLSRRIDLDYPDLGLVDTVTFTGADGSVAWEGRVSEMPRELSDTHSIGVFLTGWMAHAKDRKFTEIYVDRDLNAWGEPTSARRAFLLAANQPPTGPERSVSSVGSEALVITDVSGQWSAPFVPIAEAWYDAGASNSIGMITYSYSLDTPATGTGAPWTWNVNIMRDHVNAGATSGALSGVANAQNLSVSYAGKDCRFGHLVFSYAGTPAGTDGAKYGIAWSKIAVYGSHGLAQHANLEPLHPAGLYASDVLINLVQRFCPKFDYSRVSATAYPISHLVFKESTTPYDAFLEINKYHLWNLAVWENKTLHFGPYDLTDYDWQVRTYDPGVDFSPQGPSIDDVFNGIEVSYQDILRGTSHRLTPETNSELRSTDPTNPWNVHGIQKWDSISLSSPSTEQGALTLGQAALAERTTPKTPGTIKVRNYIRNRQGIEEPAWKVRAGDTISVTDFPNDQPRLIVETSWDDERKELSISVDRPFALLDAYIDRLGQAVAARNVG